MADGRFAGGPFDWATPFALLCGLGLVAGYALLGATWLICEDRRRHSPNRRGAGQARFSRRARLHGRWSACGRRSPFRGSPTRWFSLPNIFYPRAGAAPHRAARLRRLAVARRARGGAALLRDGRPLRALLSRPRHLDLSLSRAADAHRLGHRRGAREPDLLAHRRRSSSCRSFSAMSRSSTGPSAPRCAPGEGYH